MKLDEIIEYLEGTDDKRKQKFNTYVCPVDWVLPYLRTLLEIKKQCKCYQNSNGGSNREWERIYGGELHINILEEIKQVEGGL